MLFRDFPSHLATENFKIQKAFELPHFKAAKAGAVVVVVAFVFIPKSNSRSHGKKA